MAEMFDIIAELEALELHYRQPIGGSARAQWLVDWSRDLGHFDIEDIRRGCKSWRLNREKFPKPGELIGLIKAGAPIDRGEKTEPWRDLDDDEYRALSIRDKMRHHMIKASEAGRRAGPMFRNTSTITGKPSGVRLTPEEMPEPWHKWTAERKFHEERVRELRQIVNKPQGVPQLAAPVSRAHVGDGEVL